MRFSRRSDNPAGKCHRLVERMESMRRDGSIRFDMTCTDPTGWEERREAEAAALSFLSDRKSVSYCPDPQGLESARTLLSSGHEEKVPASDWFLTASTSEAYSILFQLLCDPGDAVVVNRPSYPLLDDLARHGGVGLIDVPLRMAETGWLLDIGRLERSFKSGRVKAFCLIQPGNPTGWFLSPEERRKVLALCARHGVALISDEVFSDYTYVDGFQSLLGATECLCFTLSGLSKGFGLPGFKLGWIAISGPVSIVDDARERLQRLNDSLLSASTPVQNALDRIWSLKEALCSPIQDRLRLNRSNWKEGLPGRLPVVAGWMGILLLPPGSEEQICDHAFDQGILVQPAFLFDLPCDAVVVSLLTEPGVFREGLEVLQDIVVSSLKNLK